MSETTTGATRPADRLADADGNVHFTRAYKAMPRDEKNAVLDVLAERLASQPTQTAEGQCPGCMGPCGRCDAPLDALRALVEELRESATRNDDNAVEHDKAGDTPEGHIGHTGGFERGVAFGKRLAAKRLNALLQQLAAAPGETGWQPIETAPRDGTILCLGNDDGRAVVMGFWSQRLWRWLQFGAAQPTVVNPTHWMHARMPLPSAPGETGATT